MSVLVADLKVFEKVYCKAVDYLYRNVCDINYCYTLRRLEHKEHVKEWVKNILFLNEWSYNVRYEDNTKCFLHDFVDFTKYHKTISTVQMLKYLQCIRYNIELETIRTGKTGMDKREIPQNLLDSFNILEATIDELKTTIICKLVPEYDTAEWSD